MKKKINLFLEFKLASGQFFQDTDDKSISELIYIRADKIHFIGIDKMSNNTIIRSCGDRYEIEDSVEAVKNKVENKLAEMFIEN